MGILRFFSRSRGPEDSAGAPFLCAITPVFDAAVESVRELVSDLKEQTFRDFRNIYVSNGPSPLVREFLQEVRRNDARFDFLELPPEKTDTFERLFLNICRRRQHCMKNYDADRYVFLDSDIKIVDREYFQKLCDAHKEMGRDVIVTQVDVFGKIMPVFPIRRGHIDIANYTFSRKIARKYDYPTDMGNMKGIGNDYRFFMRISTPGNTVILNFVSAIKDGNCRYRRLTDTYLEEKKRSGAGDRAHQ